jgi:uncharacterized tellurite resistance protein B-like protein
MPKINPYLRRIAMTHSVAEDAIIKTLSVMTKADIHISQVEVDVVQAVIKEELGIKLSSAEIRVAAVSEYSQDYDIASYLKKVSSKLELDDKKLIMRSLVKVVRADNNVSHQEKEMFNNVAKALALSAADLVSL